MYSQKDEYKFTYSYALSVVAKIGTRNMSKKLDKSTAGNKGRACFILFAESRNQEPAPFLRSPVTTGQKEASV